jgi:hypothetical protein
VTILVAEGILTEDNMPLDFKSEGLESKIRKNKASTKTSVYGLEIPLTTPEKAKAQRFSSQRKKKR